MPPIFARLYANPYVVLPATCLMWAGNSIIGRLAVGEITPMALTFLRWFFVCVLMALFYRRQALAALPALRGRWPWLIAMAALGYTGFNAFLYAAAHRTGAVNLTMLQASVPVMVLVGGAVLFRAQVTSLQMLGTALTLIGVAVVASGGEIDRLKALAFNLGDVYMLIACLFYAFYTLGLRWRPDLSGIALLAWFAVVASATSFVLFAYEAASGDFFWPTWKGWLLLTYAVICPSLLSQIFYMRGVELIGPGRAGLFINLVPVFGALMAVFFLREPFGWADAGAAVLVFGGIGVAEAGKRA